MTGDQGILITSIRQSLKRLLSFIPSTNGDIEKTILIDGAYESGMDALDTLEEELE